MMYETSYERGGKPFQPDPSRGQWASTGDFVYACIGLAFKLDLFSISYYFFFEIGIAAILPNLLCMALYLVPIMVIQSFMGQFSSSGFLSTFRLAPFFKGMGYVSLALNTFMLTYYNIFAAIPLLFLLNSFRAILPWSCEGLPEWIQNLNANGTDIEHICNITTEFIDSTSVDNSTEYEFSKSYFIPSVLYFESYFQNINLSSLDNINYTISWILVGATMFIWAVIACIFYKCYETAQFGKILRYAISTTLALLFMCFIRFMFLPGALNGISAYFTPSLYDMVAGLIAVPISTIQFFGGGWGSIIALASFNKFKTNVLDYSWLICLSQMTVFILFGLVSFMLQSHFMYFTNNSYIAFVEEHWKLYLSSASAIANLKWPNLWSIIFYAMLLIAALIVMITQIFVILKSLFDEFEALRLRKEKVTFGFIGILGLTSIFFCSNHGILYYTAFSLDSLFIQTILHLLLLLVVLWIYGRERFQRDIEFMLSKPFSTWKVNILRYVAPLCLILVLLVTLLLAVQEHMLASVQINLIAVLAIILPIFFIPGYGIFVLLETIGTFRQRFKRACRPTDWYPWNTDDRQQYEEAIGNLDTTHQLREISVDTYWNH